MHACMNATRSHRNDALPEAQLLATDMNRKRIPTYSQHCSSVKNMYFVLSATRMARTKHAINALRRRALGETSQPCATT
jgi:hypothetical protein